MFSGIKVFPMVKVICVIVSSGDSRRSLKAVYLKEHAGRAEYLLYEEKLLNKPKADRRKKLEPTNFLDY
jgi:hypothetical protein